MSDMTTGGTVKKTTKLDFRLTPDERASLAALAARNGRSVGAEMRAALDAWLARGRERET
jgi:hypothetical protein